ncbi:uncharacterized protein LOC135475086 [Liolophura sinensis]|uniref:uncharacterized protein LOC135475086 n=1 Tax=Liolophura sinensis TaxID=3198878 RepID=UPI003157FD16
MSVVNNPSGGSSKVMRVYYPQGSYKPSASPRGGAQFFKRLSTPRELATLTYDIYFAKNFNFVKGGKLPGMYGGTKTCSGGRDSSDCFSTRFMFRRDGDGEVYLYAPDNQVSNFCSDSKVICNYHSGHSLGRGTFRFRTGRWYTISQRVKLNTVGQTNGYVKVLINGSQVYYKSNLRLRNSSSVKIDGMFFSTFFGGSDSSWATPVNTYTYFRNFKMTT